MLTNPAIERELSATRLDTKLVCAAEKSVLFLRVQNIEFANPANDYQAPSSVVRCRWINSSHKP